MLINPKLKEEIVNIDGKNIRHSYDSTLGKSAIPMAGRTLRVLLAHASGVSARAGKAGLTPGQVKTGEKSNENPGIAGDARIKRVYRCDRCDGNPKKNRKENY